MSALFQPLCQVRLTNVAVVRLKSHGYRFEVACYKNKVLNWRSGIESNIDEVLQTPTVFHNVSKGEFAKKEALLQAFGTEDNRLICQRILSKGEIQVAEKERKATLDAQFKDVVTVVTELGVNPSTGLPLTRGMVEGALKDIGFSLRPSEPAKKQALRAMEQLQEKMPDQIARAQMRLRIDASKDQKNAIMSFLHQPCDATIESETLCAASISSEQNNYGQALAGEAPKVREGEGDCDSSGQPEKSGPCKAGGVATYGVIFLSDPRHYRELDQFTLESLVPPATLQLLASNVKTMRKPMHASSPNRPLDKLRHHEENSTAKAEQDVGRSMKADVPDPTCAQLAEPKNYTENVMPVEEAVPRVQSNREKTFRCSTCGIEVATAGMYRQHCHSGWHLLNLKRKVKQLSAITEQEFDEVSVDAKLGFLSVDS
eukprot:GHVS01089608.1.p1 GENE.GHVS01089608.1~~GHVS01089608.1.p1  ORF type:complete len:429 (+),score=45.83 GHVS01089608.1:82-1368(+)